MHNSRKRILIRQRKDLVRDFFNEMCNSVYWNSRIVKNKSTLSMTYEIDFKGTKLIMSTRITPKGVVFGVHNENDFPIKTSELKVLLSELRYKEFSLKNFF